MGIAKLTIIIVASLLIAVFLAIALHLAFDAKSHIDRSFAYQEMYKRALNCTATSIVNCTEAALANIVSSAQELLVGIVELVVSASLLALALTATAKLAKALASDPAY